MGGEAILDKLLSVFPQRVVEGQVAPHDCPECRALRSQLSGSAWAMVPREFIRENPDTLPLLSHEAYLAFLPAWLRQGVLEPDGEVADCLLVNLHCGTDTTGFTAEQGAAIIEVARFIVQNNGWGPEDPVNVESVPAVERTWSRAAPTLGCQCHPTRCHPSKERSARRLRNLRIPSGS